MNFFDFVIDFDRTIVFIWKLLPSTRPRRPRRPAAAQGGHDLDPIPNVADPSTSVPKYMFSMNLYRKIKKKQLTFHFVPGIILDHFGDRKSIFRYPKLKIL